MTETMFGSAAPADDRLMVLTAFDRALRQLGPTEMPRAH
jgi:hypothetical protein